MKLEPVAWTNKWYVENGKNFRHIEVMPCQHPSFDIPLYAIPPGYKLVPVEATEAMICAAVNSIYGPATTKCSLCTDEREEARDAYKHMIAAIEGEQ